MPMWNDGNFHAPLQLIIQLIGQTPKWPSKSSDAPPWNAWEFANTAPTSAEEI